MTIPMSRPIRTLVVDDEPLARRGLKLRLADAPDIELVGEASHGAEAIGRVAELAPDLMFLDVQMPEMDGFETATLIRQRDKSRDTPIIFLTALSRSETNVFRGYELGAVDYIFKPFHAEILRSKVAVFVELYRKTRALAAVNEQLQAEIAERRKAQEAIEQINPLRVIGFDEFQLSLPRSCLKLLLPLQRCGYRREHFKVHKLA